MDTEHGISVAWHGKLQVQFYSPFQRWECGKDKTVELKRRCSRETLSISTTSCKEVATYGGWSLLPGNQQEKSPQT